MGKSSYRLPSFCLSQIASRVRMRSPPLETNPAAVECSQTTLPCGSGEEKVSSDKSEQQGVVVGYVGRRVMIVVDWSSETKCALQWALSHAVQSSDTIVLLDVAKPSKLGDQQEIRERDPKEYHLLNTLRNICQAKRPEVKVELLLVEGKDRGVTIVEEATKQGISLLVLGQKRRSITWRLLMMWAGSRIDGGSVVDYCIQNSSCMALAVKRKSRRGGGYLITSRRHKDFWLLA